MQGITNEIQRTPHIYSGSVVPLDTLIRFTFLFVYNVGNFPLILNLHNHKTFKAKLSFLMWLQLQLIRCGPKVTEV